MPNFRYQAVNAQGKNLSGVMPAPDEPALEAKLKGAGLWLLEAAPEQPLFNTGAVRARTRDPGRGARLSGKSGRRELIDFSTLMTFQLRVGVPLVRALDVAAQDCKNPKFQAVLRGMQNGIESGLQLHEAMERYPHVFSQHILSVVKAGETSSKLPEIFNDLKDYLEWVEQIVNDVRQASLYPSIVLVVIMGFSIFLFTFIIPKFAELLTNLHVQQPLLTQIVFGVGDFAKHTWWIWIPLFLAVAIGIPIGRKTSKSFLFFMDSLKLKLPIFGELNRMLALSRFSHNLSLLYRAGIPILQCLKFCTSGLIGNAVVENAVIAVEEDVTRGSTISEAMHRQEVFTAMLKRMINMGETTGNLDKALNTVADYYNDVIPRTIKKVFSVAEPMLMLLLIFLVGCVALAIYLPIISLMGSIHG